MNREILFKAKRLDNGEWVEGYYVYVDYLDEHYIFASCKEHDGMHGMLSMKSYKVHPNTLCQFTGLIDKNGNKIWENDIVRHYNNKEKPERYDIGTIYWNKDNMQIARTSTLTKEIVCLKKYCIYEVIGNIFDNADLLGKE